MIQDLTQADTAFELPDHQENAIGADELLKLGWDFGQNGDALPLGIGGGA